jgi:hypothetical protein
MYACAAKHPRQNPRILHQNDRLAPRPRINFTNLLPHHSPSDASSQIAAKRQLGPDADFEVLRSVLGMGPPLDSTADCPKRALAFRHSLNIGL